MRKLSFVSLAAAVLLVVPALSHANGRPAFFLANGLTGTSEYGFTGGWNISGGLELPLAPAASLIVRADYHRIPADATSISIPWATEIGYSQSNHTAALMAGMAGLRLHPPTQTVQVYADALVGVGHLSNPKGAPIYEGSYSGQGKETNGAMSFGGGMRFVTGRAALFADAHYDYYFLDLGTPIIPIRMGLSYQ